MVRFRAVLLWACALGLVLLGTPAWAQTGSITGQVLDPGGAAIPNATVTATSGATGSSQTATTTSSGLYNFAALPPAVYTVSASATGFATVTKSNVTLNIAATLPVNFSLTVGAASTTVNVAGAAAAPIETDSSQLSTVIDAKQINSLPLVLRDPYQLVLLSPGAVNAMNNDGGFSVNGQRDRNNNFLLDGADNNDTSVPGIPGGLVNANPDSAQEFRVITNNFDAEFGRNTGAIVDVLTRGGTNSFHGSAYEFGRYNALGARDFFNTKANGPQDPYVRNDFGASVGGPILKDKLFFFLNGEVQRFRTTRTETQQVPNAAFKSGAFAYSSPDGSSTQVNLNNPGTNLSNLAGLGIDPTMAKLLAITPNGQQDVGDGVSSFLFFPSPDALNDYTLTGRMDYALTAKHQLTVRYTYGHSAESNPGHSEIFPGVGYYDTVQTAHNGSISLASTLSSSITNLARASYNQSNDGFFCQGYQGIDAITGLDSFGHGRDVTLPYFGFGTGLTYGCGVLGDSNGQARLSSTLLFGDTMTVVKSAHSIKFGGEFRNVKDTNYDDFSSRESLTLNNYTGSGAAEAYTYGGDPTSNDLPTFEDLVWGPLGAISFSSQNQFFTHAGARQANDLTRFVQREWAIFAQDTWKVTPRFTAILGVRYEFNGVPFERDGNFANFLGNGTTATPADGFEFTDVGPGTGHQLYSDSWNLVEPRIGFAWDPKGDGRTAIRGGFGTFHDRIFDNLFGNAKSNPPFQAAANAAPFPVPYSPAAAALISNTPPPGTQTPSPFIFDTYFLEPVVIDPHLKIPGTQSWNLGVQHQISDHLTAEINYVGSHTVHALREVDGAPPQPALVQQYLAAGVDPNALVGNALYFGGQDKNGNVFGPAVNNTAFLHILYQTAVVSGNYNALQARLTEQVGGLSLTGSYTFAHALDNGSDPIVPGAGGSGLPRNPFNLANEYGNSDSDVRQRFVAAGTYVLPIGHGQHFLSSGFAGRIFEGIQVSGIQQAQTGLPFELRGSLDNLHTGLTDRPQLVGKPYPSGRGKFVSGGVVTGPVASAFANAPFGEDVAIRRNTFHGPGFVNTDAVFQKTQQLHENLRLVLRVESYNLLNHPNFASPSSLNITSSSFGLSTSQVGQNDGTTGARQLQGAIKVVF